MHIILGGTGHVGAVVAQRLLDHGQAVTVITRNREKGAFLQSKGAKLAIADVYDTHALHKVFSSGKRLFLLNPPAAPSTDTASEEAKTLTSILDALDDTGIEKIVALSTYGAQPGERIGDLGVLYEMEQRLSAKAVAYTTIRAAYYMSNWDMSLPSCMQEGKVYTFFPPDLQLPMVSPTDIGQVAAGLLTEPIEKTGLVHVEGPERYSSTDVATAFSQALDKQIEAIQIPREQWIPALTSAGFSQKGAESMAAMTSIVLERKYEFPSFPLRGKTTLGKYIANLVRK